MAVRAADQALDTEAVQRIWEEANRRSHERLVLLLDDKGEFVRTTDGNVTIDLSDVVMRVGDRVGLGEQLSERLPPDAGQIVVVESDQLEAAQTGVRITEVPRLFRLGARPPRLKLGDLPGTRAAERRYAQSRSRSCSSG